MTDSELMQEALESIEWLRVHLERDHGCLHMKPAVSGIPDWLNKTEASLRARLAQPEPAECDGGQCGIGGYCAQCTKTQPEQESVGINEVILDSIRDSSEVVAPPQREWVGLTAEERREIINDTEHDDRGYVMALVEAKLKEKNT